MATNKKEKRLVILKKINKKHGKMQINEKPRILRRERAAGANQNAFASCK